LEYNLAMRSRLVAWAWIFLAWTALALFFGISLWLNYIALGREAHLGASLRVSLSEWWIWALLTPIPIWLANRWPPVRPHVVRHAGLHAVAGLIVAFAKVQAERIVRIWIFGAAPYFLPSNLALHFLIYWAIVVLTLGAAYYRRSRTRELEASRTEARLQEARLQLLASQLQPHFLFNALNTIAETVHEDPERADRMIGGLSELLRATLQQDGYLVALADELSLADRYLAIQQARFGDRLQVEIDVPDGLRGYRVPRLILQPLLENAIHHGVGTRVAGGRIRIGADRSDDVLRLTIQDNGGTWGDKPVVDTRGLTHGIGLSNTHARLAAMYGGRARAQVTSTSGEGTTVTLTLPIPP
jgi:signal transduction histidine kinase